METIFIDIASLYFYSLWGGTAFAFFALVFAMLSRRGVRGSQYGRFTSQSPLT